MNQLFLRCRETIPCIWSVAAHIVYPSSTFTLAISVSIQCHRKNLTLSVELIPTQMRRTYSKRTFNRCHHWRCEELQTHFECMYIEQCDVKTVEMTSTWWNVVFAREWQLWCAWRLSRRSFYFGLLTFYVFLQAEVLKQFCGLVLWALSVSICIKSSNIWILFGMRLFSLYPSSITLFPALLTLISLYFSSLLNRFDLNPTPKKMFVFDILPYYRGVEGSWTIFSSNMREI